MSDPLTAYNTVEQLQGKPYYPETSLKALSTLTLKENSHMEPN